MHFAGCGSSAIAVPNIRNRSIEQGYALLRSNGFRVSVSAPFTSSSYLDFGVLKTIPAAGSHVAPGSVVTLVPGFIGGGLGSPVGALRPKHYRVPDFAGDSPAVVMRWVNGHPTYWSFHLSQLKGSTAPNLFAAYVIAAQRPAAGAPFPRTAGSD